MSQFLMKPKIDFAFKEIMTDAPAVLFCLKCSTKTTKKAIYQK